LVERAETRDIEAELVRVDDHRTVERLDGAFTRLADTALEFLVRDLNDDRCVRLNRVDGAKMLFVDGCPFQT